MEQKVYVEKAFPYYIRKCITYARTLFLTLFFVCLALTIISVDGPSFVFPIICTIIGSICFGISYALDCLLDDNNSPFMHQ